MTVRRALTWVVAACSAALLVPLLVPLLTGRVFVTYDLTWFHLPTRYLYQQALRSGDTVLWTPSILSGVYLHGEGQVGLFHPLHQFLYRLLPLQAAFNLELIANYPAAFAGMYVFLRRLQLAPPAALFGSMLFAFSGFNLLHHQHLNMLAIVAHMPWLLVAADVLIADDRPRAQALAFAAIAVIVASELLLGFPQGVWWNLMTLAAFAAYRAYETGCWWRFLACGPALAIGAMLAGIQVIPSSDAFAHSDRQWLGAQFSLSFSLHPFDLVQLWSPYGFRKGTYSGIDSGQFHEFGIYSGAVLPIALVWVWTRSAALRDRRLFIIGATAFAGLNLLLAFGRFGGLAGLLSYAPGLGSLRAPVRYIVLVQFALAILTAIAFDDILAIVEGRRPVPSGRTIAVWLPAVLGIATVVAFNAGAVAGGRRVFTSVATAAPGVLFVIAVTLLVVLAARRTPSALAALALVTMVDLGAWGIRYVYRQPPQTIDEVTNLIPPSPQDPAESYAALEGKFRSDLLVMKGYRLTTGYLGLYPAAFYRPDGLTSRKLSGTRWIFTQDGFRSPAQGSVARARLVDESGRDASGSARLVVDRPGNLVAEVESPGPRILALTERFHDGWSATSDGRPLPLVRVEQDFLGCPVDQTAHRVELRFRPRSFVRGMIASAVGGVLLIVAVAIGFRPRTGQSRAR
jgi:hypothetical protein